MLEGINKCPAMLIHPGHGSAGALVALAIVI
jgi:hypothetical protein